MRSAIGVLVLFFGLSAWANAQEGALIRPSRVLIHTQDRGLPSATCEYNREAISEAFGTLVREEPSPVAFTALAVAWQSDDLGPEGTLPPLRIRSKTASGEWTGWQDLGTAVLPSESPSGLFWSDLATTPDGTAHLGFEIRLPDELVHSASVVKVIAVDTRDSRRSRIPEEPLSDEGPLELHPPIVPRSAWWGDLPSAYLNPTNYTPEYITITHAVVHHTAGANNPPDPAQDIRAIWYYHVFGQGWSDIAYNFLIDQFGTVYHGRYNPYVDLLEVRGSHATYANNQSVGISLLGTFNVDTPPSTAAVQSLTRVIAWRFQQRHLDPLSQADMITDQAGNTVRLHRISGHRDISPTACPGDALHAQLPTIRMTADMLIRSDDSTTVPHSFSLAQNYPNPFNPATTIEYVLPEEGHVSLRVFDLLGREVRRLVDGVQSEGPHTASFDGSMHPTGPYFCVLVQGSRVSTRKMMMIR